MKSSKKQEYPGLFDYKDSTELDDIAYELYFEKEFNNPLIDNYWWTQDGFVNTMRIDEKRKYYKQATIILRGLKIDKLKNETEI